MAVVLFRYCYLPSVCWNCSFSFLSYLNLVFNFSAFPNCFCTWYLKLWKMFWKKTARCLLEGIMSESCACVKLCQDTFANYSREVNHFNDEIKRLWHAVNALIPGTPTLWDWGFEWQNWRAVQIELSPQLSVLSWHLILVMCEAWLEIITSWDKLIDEFFLLSRSSYKTLWRLILVMFQGQVIVFPPY